MKYILTFKSIDGYLALLLGIIIFRFIYVYNIDL